MASERELIRVAHSQGATTSGGSQIRAHTFLWAHAAFCRPDYAKLGNFRADFPKVPIMALTASATPKVQDDM